MLVTVAGVDELIYGRHYILMKLTLETLDINEKLTNDFKFLCSKDRMNENLNFENKKKKKT